MIQYQSLPCVHNFNGLVSGVDHVRAVSHIKEYHFNFCSWDLKDLILTLVEEDVVDVIAANID